MKELLYVNACMRGDFFSRTSDLSHTFLNKWKSLHPDWTINERDLTESNLPILTAKRAEVRDQIVADGRLDDSVLIYAQELARADKVVVAAPTWDLTFPAILKVYIEWACTMGITFHYTKHGNEGLCKAEKLLYITSMGGPLKGQTCGIDYMRGLTDMWGIPQFDYVACTRTDMIGDAGEKNLVRAKNQLINMAEVW